MPVTGYSIYFEVFFGSYNVGFILLLFNFVHIFISNIIQWSNDFSDLSSLYDRAICFCLCPSLVRVRTEFLFGTMKDYVQLCPVSKEGHC